MFVFHFFRSASVADCASCSQWLRCLSIFQEFEIVCFMCFLQVMFAKNTLCFQYITVPTRITANGTSAFDIYVSNLSDSDVTSGALLCDTSDHLLICLLNIIGGKK